MGIGETAGTVMSFTRVWLANRNDRTDAIKWVNDSISTTPHKSKEATKNWTTFDLLSLFVDVNLPVAIRLDAHRINTSHRSKRSPQSQVHS